MRALRWAGKFIAALLLSALATLAGLWVWSGSEGSLSQLANGLERVLPRVLTDGQTLLLQDVHGVLRDGGSVGLLQWQHGAQKVEVQDLQIAWDWRALQSGTLHVPRLHARLLRYEDSSAAAPLVELHLPIPLDVTLDIDTLELVGPPALTLQALRGHYAYDGSTHNWDLKQVRIAEGTYSAQGSLKANAPMDLRTQLQGMVPVPVPGSKAHVEVKASATIAGTLSAPDGVLDITANLQGDATSAAMQATARLRLQPWKPQPVVTAQAQFQGVDLAALWPRAPVTALTGRVEVVPQGDSWNARVTTTNSRSGPWDTRHLPLQNLDAALSYRNGQWVVQTLQAGIAGGAVLAQGQFRGKPENGSVTLALKDVHTEQLDTRLGTDVLSGQASAQQTDQGIGFAIALSGNAWARQGAPQPADAPLLSRLKSLQAQGTWKAPQLSFSVLSLQSHDASLQGPLSVNVDTWESSGQLQASVPGAQASLNGTLGVQQGEGALTVHATDTDALLHWLARFAPNDTAPGGLFAKGALDLDAHWSGGWHKQGADMQVNAVLQSEGLLFDAGSPVRLSGLRATIGGSLPALKLQLQGQLDAGTKTLNLQTLLHAGLNNGALLTDQQWAISLDALQLTLKDAQSTGVWNAELAHSVALQLASGKGGSALDIAPGALRLSGPAPGAALVEWKAARWRKKAPDVARWQTQGRISGLPSAWLELLGQTELANLGLRGDLMFGGTWDASMDEHFRLRAELTRTAGDFQLLSQDQTSTLLRAGLRDATVQLQIDDELAALKLVWNSDSAGNAAAEFQTRLQNRNGWSWPADAPVTATIRTKLPRVGVWSLLAPPGWRIQGTLDSNMALSGTRANPNWSGVVEARDMAIRSVVDGIDFSKGVLRLKLDGQRMEIAEFTLQGAGGTVAGDSGGLLKATGQVLWITTSESATPSRLASRVHLELDAVAQQLRVSARADQRLTVSGKLSAKLDDAHLTLRGALVADQAQFLLPDDSAPQLGSDVVVRPRASRKSAASPVTTKPRGVTLDVDVTLDPGTNFHLKGQGIDTRLEGKLTLRTDSSVESLASGPRLSGQLRTVGGSYKAYGQTLDIETGVLRFNGPYDNPALDILALRPNLQQTVGVQIGGTAKLPVVRLYSEPDMADAEKLSWLVLGRASSTSGADYALLQSAALALMAGRGQGPTSGLIKAFGLDEVSLGEANTTNADGSAGTAATTVKLGKRLTRDFYVAYERSIATTLGTFYVFYDLSRRFTLRAESGSTTAVDLIFTTRFD